MVKQLSSRVHPASQVDPMSHSQELLELMDAKLNRNVVALVVDHVADAVDYAFSRPGPSSSPKEHRGRSLARSASPFSAFVTRVLVNAEVKMPVVLTTLAYIERARPHLQIALEEWACERVFLGALIVASKYTNDSTLKNVHWAYCTGVFGKSDVGRIEREFLDVLAFELSTTEEDLAPYIPDLAVAARLHERRRPAPVEVAPATVEVVSAPASPASSVSSTRTAVSDEAVPELSPASSPRSSSSSSSASPQTPPAPTALPSAMGPARTTKPPTKAKRHSPLDLLRAIPGLHHHHRRTSSTEVSPKDSAPSAHRSSLVWA